MTTEINYRLYKIILISVIDKGGTFLKKKCVSKNQLLKASLITQLDNNYCFLLGLLCRFNAVNSQFWRFLGKY